MKTLATELSEAIARKKFAKAARAAVRTFVDFIDPRHVGTAVYAAGCANRLEAVRLLHEMRADLDKPATDEAGATTAHIAAQQGHTAMVQLLYDLGADVHRAANTGDRPIHAAAQLGHDKILLLLISLRADIDSPGMIMRPPLMSATECGHVSTVRTLITAKCDVNRTDQDGFSAADVPLHLCGEKILQLLRDNGCISRPRG